MKISEVLLSNYEVLKENCQSVLKEMTKERTIDFHKSSQPLPYIEITNKRFERELVYVHNIKDSILYVSKVESYPISAVEDVTEMLDLIQEIEDYNEKETT